MTSVFYSPKHFFQRYLATGDSYFTIAMHHLAAESTVNNIVKETSAALANVLGPIYLRAPEEEDWLKISQGFWEKWNLPNCLGAIDGKHIVIKAPPNSGTLFFNYKKTFSVVLMAVADHKYKFSLVDIGAYGGESDGGILNRSPLGQSLQNEKLNFPNYSALLPGSNVGTHHYLVGDEAFGISPRMMRPFPVKVLNCSRRIFNYRLSRARRIVENAFGILAERWRVLKTTIPLITTNVDRIVVATVVLHNFIMTETEKQYCSAGFVDVENERGEIIPGRWRRNQPLNPINAMSASESTRIGLNTREKLETYFMTPEGAISWQLEYIAQGQHQDEFVPF